MLLAFLGYSICKGFDEHLTAAEHMLVKAAAQSATDGQPSATSAPNAPASAASAASAPEHQPKSSNGKAEAKSTAPPKVAASSAEASLHELLATSVKAIASTTVAVIWVLVIAISVITISITRAVLSLNPKGLDSSADGEKGGKPDGTAAISLPGLEFAKEVIKLVTDTAQSIRK